MVFLLGFWAMAKLLSSSDKHSRRVLFISRQIVLCKSVRGIYKILLGVHNLKKSSAEAAYATTAPRKRIIFLLLVFLLKFPHVSHPGTETAVLRNKPRIGIAQSVVVAHFQKNLVGAKVIGQAQIAVQTKIPPS